MLPSFVSLSCFQRSHSRPPRTPPPPGGRRGRKAYRAPRMRTGPDSRREILPACRRKRSTWRVACASLSRGVAPGFASGGRSSWRSSSSAPWHRARAAAGSRRREGVARKAMAPGRAATVACETLLPFFFSFATRFGGRGRPSEGIEQCTFGVMALLFLGVASLPMVTSPALIPRLRGPRSRRMVAARERRFTFGGGGGGILFVTNVLRPEF